MEQVQDPSRLADHFARHHMADRFPWLNRYPWSLLHSRKGESLCRYGGDVPRLLFLLEGRVAVSITPSHGRTHLITCYDPVALICGDVEVALGNTHATADLRAIDGEVWCAALPIAVYRERLMADPDFLRYTVQRLAREMVKDSIYATNNLLFPLEERLGAYLVNHAREGVFQGNLTRTAELLGVSYRQLSRVMKVFSDRAWIEKDSGGWRILQPAPLERMADRMDEPPAASDS